MTELVIAELRKRFGATAALAGVSLRLHGGRILALLGENGAGKSTLIKILSGVYRPDSGQISIDGKTVRFANPAAAIRAGIVLVPQEVRLVPMLTVAENILLGHLPVRRLAGVLPVVNHQAIREKARAVLEDIGVDLDVDHRAGDLTLAERQLAVIARALGRRARILILDEPTASLERREVEHLFSVVRRLRNQGVAVIYISHRLEEVQMLADECLVMRDGHVVTRIDAPPFEPAALIKAMTGRMLDSRHEAVRTPGKVRLNVAIDGGNLSCRQNEIVGLGGLLGNGAASLLLRIFGGSIVGDEHSPGAIRSSIARGIGFVPGDRAHALVMALSVRDNIVLPHLDAFARTFERDERRIDAVVAPLMELLDIRPKNPELPVRNLSGGNQQKVAFAKWLVGHLELLLLDEPTTGIDIAAKAAIHRRIGSFAAAGGAVLMSTSDTTELLALSDTVTVLRQGRAVGRMDRGKEFSEARLRDLLESHQ